MTVHLDYTQLHEQPPHLTLEESLGGYFSAVDQQGRLHYPPTRDMDKVIRAMRARAIRGHATLDEESITWFRALREFGEFSVRADRPQSEGGTMGGAGRNVPVPPAIGHEPASPLSEIGAASPPPAPAAPVRLRLVN